MQNESTLDEILSLYSSCRDVFCFFSLLHLKNSLNMELYNMLRRNGKLE